MAVHSSSVQDFVFEKGMITKQRRVSLFGI
jgi:hypothetical protein